MADSNYQNGQLEFSLLKMGQVEIQGTDRKRSRERKGPREINFNWYQTTWQQQSEQAPEENCMYWTQKTCTFSHQQRKQQQHTYVHIYTTIFVRNNKQHTPIREIQNSSNSIVYDHY